MISVLDLAGVGLVIGGRPILQDLNLHVLPGEIHAILDEPDSGIDALSLNRILEAVRTLAKNGASVLLIAHQNEIAASADRASSLCGGTVLRTGDPAAIGRFFRDHCRECPHGNAPPGEVPLHE